MAELIAIIILVGSLIGMMVIIFQKIPDLIKLPETAGEFSLKNNLLKLKEKLGRLNPLSYSFGEMFLQRILSKTRILALRVERKIADWLQRLREKSLKRKIKENDNYWKELKK